MAPPEQPIPHTLSSPSTPKITKPFTISSSMSSPILVSTAASSSTPQSTSSSISSPSKRLPPNPISSTSTDDLVSNALVSWLISLNLANHGDTFEQATHQCISLCSAFTQFANNLMSERDFFTNSVVNANVSRQRRYNTRRLARNLSTWFGIRSDSLSNSSSNKPNHDLPITLNSRVTDALLNIADSPDANDAEDPRSMLLLAECVLCAAVHSDEKERFINSVLTLPMALQDALALSIKRTTVEPKKQPKILGPIPMNDENIKTDLPVPVLYSNSLSPAKPVRDGQVSVDPLTVPRGIPLADYKALAAERDNLRRKLASSESEKNKANNVADGLRRNLEEADDKIRALTTSKEEQEAEMVTKSNALNEVKNALRNAHVAAEELDMLRAKAASAEQLEASLKRASKRLEEVSDMRRINKDLESQMSAFRENEERLTKHTEYLESQLSSSTDRVQKLAALSDNLSADVEKKEEEITSLNNVNSELQSKLEVANNQLASMLMQSTHTVSREDDVPTSHSTSGEDDEAGDNNSSDGSERHLSTAMIEQSNIDTTFNAKVVTDALFDEIGVKMEWHDVVECIRGVMDALKEMEDGEESMAPRRDPSELTLSDSPSLEHLPLDNVPNPRPSQQSVRSDVDSHQQDAGSDADSRVSLLPDFRELDSKLKAENCDGGDEFDFAANHKNVREIPVSRKQSSQLPTIPENREGFEATVEGAYDDVSTQNTTSYSSSNDYESADETINATMENPAGPVPATGASYSTMNGEIEMNFANEIDNLVDAQPRSPRLDNDDVTSAGRTADSQYGSINMNSRGHSFHHLKKATSLTISVRSSGMSRSASHSETRALVRQAQSDLSALQNAMEMMRCERRSCSSISALVSQLEATRKELAAAQERIQHVETENGNLRRELNVLLKELDSINKQKKENDVKEAIVIREKERLIDHLQKNLDTNKSELAITKEELVKSQQKVNQLENSEKALTEKLEAAQVIERTHEVEIARLTAKVETEEVLTARLNAVVSKTDGLTSQISKQRQDHLNEVAEAAKREKMLAEQARDEAKRVAEKQATFLEDVRASAAAMNRSRISEDPRLHSSRKSTRFHDFWRRLLHRERVTIDFTMPGASAPLTSEEQSTPRRAAKMRSGMF